MLHTFWCDSYTIVIILNRQILYNITLCIPQLFFKSRTHLHFGVNSKVAVQTNPRSRGSWWSRRHERSWSTMEKETRSAWDTRRGARGSGVAGDARRRSRGSRESRGSGWSREKL